MLKAIDISDKAADRGLTQLGEDALCIVRWLGQRHIHDISIMQCIHAYLLQMMHANKAKLDEDA